MCTLIAVSCGIPETDANVYYLSCNSTLEGSTVTFRCTDMLHDEIFTSVCYRNASWFPDPISKCTSLRSGNLKINCDYVFPMARSIHPIHDNISSGQKIKGRINLKGTSEMVNKAHSFNCRLWFSSPSHKRTHHSIQQHT